MIYTERTISVKNGTASIDAPIVLYRGDRNIEILFTIINSKFKFSEKGNYILDIGAKYGQLAVDLPNGDDLFTEVAECVDGAVVFKITGDMINDLVELGFYSFHVRLFNDDMSARVTIPPIMEGIEIREPIIIEGDEILPIVDTGVVDVAIIDGDNDETLIDENGKLTFEWRPGDLISSTRLNAMVDKINMSTSGGNDDSSGSDVDLTNYATKEYVDIQDEGINANIGQIESELADVRVIAETARDKVVDIPDLDDYATIEYVDNMDEDINMNIGRIESELADVRVIAEAARDNNEAGPDLSEYVTKEYVDDKYDDTSAQIESLNTSLAVFEGTMNTVTNDIAKHETSISDINAAIGNINDILDNINGEVI